MCFESMTKAVFSSHNIAHDLSEYEKMYVLKSISDKMFRTDDRPVPFVVSYNFYFFLFFFIFLFIYLFFFFFFFF